MKLARSPLQMPSIVAEADQAERELALEVLADAWNEAEDDGITPNALAHAALFAALATFVRQHGEESAAKLVESLPDKLRSGEYSVERRLQ